jgi:molybdate transport system ATP-binding protein
LGNQLWLDTARRIEMPPQRRRAGMVFQQYALFPHLTVAGNVGFGVPPAVRKERVARWLRAFHIDAIAHKHPSRISGGQRQRVALARALAAEPAVLLLDEPFSAIDADLRQHLRRLFREVIADGGRPVLLVTHDLEDARELADRVGVLVSGELRRFGPTQEVFRDPKDLAVARVLGWRNLLPVERIESNRATGPWGSLTLGDSQATNTRYLGIQPHHLRLAADGELRVTVRRSLDLETHVRVECRLPNGTPLSVFLDRHEPRPSNGECIALHAEQVIGLSTDTADLKPKKETVTPKPASTGIQRLPRACIQAQPR